MLDLKSYYENGFFIFRNLIPFYIIDNYIKVYEENNHLWLNSEYPGKYDYQSFKITPDILNILLCKEVTDSLSTIEHNPTALHAAFVPWRQVSIDWHYDLARELEDYPDFITHKKSDSIHTGVWIALDDITHAHGPFTYIPGSHHWDYMAQRHLNDDKDLFEFFNFFRNSKKDFKEEFFLAKKGDVLIWDGRLLHCVNAPQKKLQRKAIIGHYSAIKKNAVPYKNGFYHNEWPTLTSNKNFPYET